jgi:Sodium/calcium exchanger protein
MLFQIQLLGDATEQASLKLGQTVGGLMNATFGNAVELIVAIVALLQGQLRIVQTSLLGSILSNILLVLGMSFVAGGMFRKESVFQQTAAQASGSILLLGGITVVIPAAYQGSKRTVDIPEMGMHALDTLKSSDRVTEDGLLFISRGTSIVLLCIYIIYLIFQLKTHNFLFEADVDEDEEEEEMKMTPVAAIAGLLAVTVVTSFNADYLVGAIDEVAQEYHIPKSFIVSANRLFTSSFVMLNFAFLAKGYHPPANRRQRRRARHVSVDGRKEQDGNRTWRCSGILYSDCVSLPLHPFLWKLLIKSAPQYWRHPCPRHCRLDHWTASHCESLSYIPMRDPFH